MDNICEYYRNYILLIKYKCDIYFVNTMETIDKTKIMVL